MIRVKFPVAILKVLIVIVHCLTGFHTYGQFESSNLPIILIDTEAEVSITKERKTARMRVIDNPNERNQISGPFNNYDGQIAIKGRGSSSWENYEKKGYTLETQLSTGENNNVSLLGMPEENDWVLHGPYADKTLMKNAFVYDLGASMGRYAPRHEHCELVINGEYRGVYLLVEQIKKDKNRVDIATLDPEENSGDDLTGGYIIRIDRDEEDGFSWKADFGFDLSYFNYYYPKGPDMSPEQRTYIRNYLEDFESALTTFAYDDPVNGYKKYIDLSSFIDYFLISELTKNIDAYRLSTYIYKDKDSKGGKLTMGPIWDFNLSCGGINIGFGDWGAQPQNWVHQELPGGVPFWWETFLNDRDYNACLKERWTSLRQNVFTESNFASIIDQYALLLDEAKERNFEIFPLAEAVWGNNHSGLTYKEEIGELKDFMNERLVWMHGAINNLPASSECLICINDCEPSVISDISAVGGVTTFPNPASTQLTYRMSKGNSPNSCTLELFDLSGSKLSSISGMRSSHQDEWVFDLTSTNNKGVIIYRLYADHQLINMGKLSIK